MNRALEAARAIFPGLDWRDESDDAASAEIAGFGDTARLYIGPWEEGWGATLVVGLEEFDCLGSTPAKALQNLRVAVIGYPPEVLRRWVALGGDLEEWKP